MFLAIMAACGSGTLEPARFDAANQPCAHCRMVGSNGRFAAQLASIEAEPLFFDDIGCFRDYLRGGQPVGADAIAFVVDHRTGDWVRATEAVFTEHVGVETPMGSHLLAHRTTESRNADPSSTGGTPRSRAEIFGSLTLPGGTP